MNFKHLVLKNRDVPEALHHAMRDLHASNSVYRDPFFHPELITIMSKIRDDLHLFWGEDEKGLVFYWPMHISKARTARGIGGPFSDRDGPVLRIGAFLDIESFLSQHNIRKYVSNGFIQPEIAETDTFLTVPNNETYIAGPFEEYYETQRAQHASHFKRWRRLRRKLDSDFSNVDFNFDDQSDETFEKIIEMKQAQYLETGLHNVLGPKWSKDMFRALKAKNGDDFRLRVTSLKLNGILVAGEMNLQSHNTLHGWIVVYDKAYSKYSLGNLLVLYILEQLQDHGLSYYDSGPGSEHYTKYFTNQNEPLGVGTLRRSKGGFGPQTAMEKTWRIAEAKAPKKLSRLLQKTRRRSEQILAAEVETLPRIKGFIRAVSANR